MKNAAFSLSLSKSGEFFVMVDGQEFPVAGTLVEVAVQGVRCSHTGKLSTVVKLVSSRGGEDLPGVRLMPAISIQELMFDRTEVACDSVPVVPTEELPEVRLDPTAAAEMDEFIAAGTVEASAETSVEA